MLDFGALVPLLVLPIAGGPFILYMLPTIVAKSRGADARPVAIVNVFLGWTLAGWVAALAMAYRSADR